MPKNAQRVRRHVLELMFNFGAQADPEGLKTVGSASSTLDYCLAGDDTARDVIYK